MNLVVHLAAKTETDPAFVLNDYDVNMKGTENVLECTKKIASIKRIIITSTQFVFQVENEYPKSDVDYSPHTIYGQSKVQAERLTRESDLRCAWTIIRPTNVWGPWHPRYPQEFWKIIGKGLYIHPSGKKVVRSYAYVGNVVWQIEKILKLDVNVVDRQTFYVGDSPIDLLDWVNGFSCNQIGRKVLLVPRLLVRILGYIGDVLYRLHVKFPITSSRYRSMTMSNSAPMQKTIEVLGQSPYSLDEGIRITVEWLRQYHPSLVRV